MEPPSRDKMVPTQPVYREKPKDRRPWSWCAPMGNHTVDTIPHSAEGKAHDNE